MKNLKDYDEFINEAKIPAGLEALLKQFPDNAKNWGQATDELADIANLIEEILGITNATNITGVDFGKSKTPSEYNKKHKKRIRDGWKKLNDTEQKQVLNHFEIK